MHKMKLPTLPVSRPEIWRLAIYLHCKFAKASDWPAADKVGWYRMALEVHNEVFRQRSPYLAHDVPMEAYDISFRDETR